MKFYKYHGLGNDYLIIDPKDTNVNLTRYAIQQICHRNYGVGSDGILYGPMICDGSAYKVRIFNPDGSEAEKSGNGLRIFSRYLYDMGLVKEQEFTIETIGGSVCAQVMDQGRSVKVSMGKVSFDSDLIPVAGEKGEVIDREMLIDGQSFLFSAATIGNPHCIISLHEVSPELARRYGPLIETDPRFPNRTNVQFMKVIDRSHIQIEIWERGAGYTLASGSSSVASAAVACKTGVCGNSIIVKMQGGELKIHFDDQFNATMVGSVASVCVGELQEEFLNKIEHY